MTLLNERRRAPRRDKWFALEIGRKPDRRHLAIGVNASSTGALLGSPRVYDVGEDLHISFVLGAEDDIGHARGRVVRILPDAADGPWRHRMAVAFERPVSQL